MQLAITVDLAALFPCLQEQIGLSLVLIGSPAQRVLQPGVKSTRVNPQKAAHRPHRKLQAMQGNERVLHFASLAKYAAAFLRNTVSNRYRCQLVAHGPGAALEIRNDAATMPFIVGRSAWIMIGHPKSQGIVEKDGNLAGLRRHGLLLNDAPCQPSVKRAEGGVTSSNRGGSQPQQRRGAVRGSTCPGRKHFAAGDLVAGCEAEPRCEVLGRGPCPQTRSALADKLERERGAEAVNLGQICPCEAV